MTGEEFRSFRIENKMTQEKIARVIDRSVGTIRLWESRENRSRDIIDPVLARGITETINDYNGSGRIAA